MSAARTGLFFALAVSVGAVGCKRTESRQAPAGATAQATSTAKAQPVSTRETSAQPISMVRPAIAVLRVAHVKVPFKLDGELDEPAWNASGARTGAFVDATGGEARPYSDARFLWDDENLYVGLYAADDDIEAHVTAHDGPVWIDDAFSLHLRPAAPGSPTYGFDISASGVVTDVKRMPGGKDDARWESGIKVGVDRDGTLNDASNEDEEWVIEAAIPLRALGLTPKEGTRFLVDISRCDTPRRTKEKRCGSWGSPHAQRELELAP